MTYSWSLYLHILDFFKPFFFLLLLITSLPCTIQRSGHVQYVWMDTGWLIQLHSEPKYPVWCHWYGEAKWQGFKYQQFTWDLPILFPPPRARVSVITKVHEFTLPLPHILIQIYIWLSQGAAIGWTQGRWGILSPGVPFPAHCTFR